ncbi:MAG: cytochrome c3 family protein [Pirellulaceae bacterium]
MGLRTRIVLAAGLVLLAALGYWRLSLDRGTPQPVIPVAAAVAAPPPIQVGRDEYVSSHACQKCHPVQHQTWHNSYHRTMTQVAGPQSVVAPFDDVHLESRGRSYHLERRGDEFWITMTEPQLESELQGRGNGKLITQALPLKAQQVVLTTGSHVAQTYWVAVANELWQVPWLYHIEEQRWIPDNDSFLQPPDTGHLYHQWNTVCVKCHTSAPIPGQTDQSIQRTQVAELGIACEACHGPGEAHVRFRQHSAQPQAVAASRADDPITNPARCDPKLASQICAQCHSSHSELDLPGWLAHGSSFRPGEDLETKVRMHRPNAPETKREYGQGYWGDGTCRTGGDEYLGLIASKCYEGGNLSCLSCHSMHGYESNTDQLKPKMNGQQACLQCHAEIGENISQHTHHGAESSGSDCMNCHMPHITYALFKGIRSHRIDSPSAAVTAATGRPNACNLCHLDKPLGWTAEKLTQWHGQPAVELSEQQKTTSSMVTMALQGEAAQRVIAAWHLGWEPARQASRDDWEAPFLAYLLDDPYSVVRYVSFRSLKKLPGYSDFSYDFVAPKGARQQAKKQALEIWQAQTRQPPGDGGAATLLDEQGQLRTESAEELYRKRDDRRMLILE